MSQRSRVIQLYKTLQYLGREYPVSPEKFRVTCKKTFKNNSKETSPEKIAEMIAKGEYVVKEIESLYALKKYRAMLKRYYD
ncbi:CLUMA_CG000034, isoform A [Clunio marinus]|uniref:CLUMA_CG000034, isoform A n=1 Tax=Clunio marinus TaxID=568069 RepID=A0A1J1HFG6_9DIPT|nr:CLUMA_CG000034, isoform A [Clunio marinus]